MHIKMRKIASVLALAAALLAGAAPVDEGRRLYLEGNYQEAVEQLRPVVRRTPRDGNANFYLGASLSALGQYADAKPYLVKAADRGVTDAYRILTLQSLEQYDPESASDYISSWRSKLTRNRREVPEELETLSSRAVMLRNMLARVESIEILDSIVVGAEDFFQAYRLSEPAGRILPPEAVRRVGAGEGAFELGTAFMPQNRTEMLWAQADTTGTMALYGAGILDDGTLEHSAPLDAALAEGGSAAYPFLMPDGMTLYFANTGDNSLGGYDIFMTRRDHDSDDGDTYLQPQNIGMPYNSPYDDYMLAIDEHSGLGWWATDRNQIADSLTIYVFAPAEMRVNVEPTDSNLVALARLSDISLTRRAGVDYDALLAGKLPERRQETHSPGQIFTLDLGGGTVYTQLNDFRNNAARSAMVEYLGARMALDRHLAQEQALRDRYRNGDRSVASQIEESEADTARQRRTLRNLLNSAIRLERRN